MDNIYAKEYELEVIAADPYSDVSDYVWNQNFTINRNYPPIVNTATVVDQSVLPPDGHTWSFGSSVVSDPEGLSFTEELEFNGSSTVPSWISYDASDYTFSIVSTSNVISGNHSIGIVLTDDFNPPEYYTFNLEIRYNSAPVSSFRIGELIVVTQNTLEYTFDDVNDLFTDPDNRPMTYSITQSDGLPIPVFMTLYPEHNTIVAKPEEAHSGKWPLLYVAEDDYGNTGTIPFMINVKRKLTAVITIACYYRCFNCTGSDYNECTICRDEFLLQYNQCKAECIGAFYPDYENKQCLQCHDFCKITFLIALGAKCTGPTNVGCEECAEDHFRFENTCVDTCPPGYFEDRKKWECVK